MQLSRRIHGSTESGAGGMQIDLVHFCMVSRLERCVQVSSPRSVCVPILSSLPDFDVIYGRKLIHWADLVGPAFFANVCPKFDGLSRKILRCGSLTILQNRFTPIISNNAG